MILKTSQDSFADSPKWVKLIGIPYQKQDCWGIVRLFYQIEFGIELKSYYDEVPNDMMKTFNLISAAKGEFFSVDDPKFGDIITMKLMGIECHIGIFLNANILLHTQKGTGCMIDRMAQWKNRITGYWRVREMTK